MLNVLFNPKKAERHPIEMMFIGIFYSSISILLSSWIFPDYASLVMVFFSVLSCLYVVQGAIKLEESKDKRNRKSEKWLLRQHSKLLMLFLFLFLGFVFSFTFWTIVLPNNMVTNIFNLQASVVEGIRALVGTGNLTGNSSLFIILMNNMKVMMVSMIFALFYGAGAIFILAWNASVMGFVIGEITRNKIGISALPIAFFKYFLHGIPEMLAYFTMALVGGIIYVAIVKGDFFNTKVRMKIVKDLLVLIVVSFVFLLIGALLEVYVSPYI